ncbi:MAG: hypothetical protein KatS3mg008_2028 [Acidimicrobiales bacterium]|nr:MAG: hypothetical protein KatS3mg008_2028 [Acidimicrobiales bacterium]
MDAVRLTRRIVVAVTIVLAQVSVAPELGPGRLVPDLCMIAVVGVGFALGREAGGVLGFCMGLGVDSALPTPFGLSSLAYVVAGWLAGELQSLQRETPLLVRMLVAGSTAAVARLVFLLSGEIAGNHLLELTDWWIPVVASGASAFVGSVPVQMLLDRRSGVASGHAALG